MLTNKAIELFKSEADGSNLDQKIAIVAKTLEDHCSVALLTKEEQEAWGLLWALKEPTRLSGQALPLQVRGGKGGPRT